MNANPAMIPGPLGKDLSQVDMTRPKPGAAPMTEITEEKLAALVRNLRSRMCMNMADGVECGGALPLGSPQYGCTCGEAAETITALIAEVRRLRGERDEAVGSEDHWVRADEATRAELGERFTLAPPDGGDVKTYEAARLAISALSAAEAEVARLREMQREYDLRLLQRETEAWTDDDRVEAAEAEVARLREALRPFVAVDHHQDDGDAEQILERLFRHVNASLGKDKP